MRMRKKQWADPFLNEHPELVLSDPAIYKGKWKELFGLETLRLEIGTGKGDYITQMAAIIPDCSWIGIEKEHNVAAVAAKKALMLEKQNVRLIPLDAAALDEWFAAGELEAIHLNFSDPWPKRGYQKRRLSHRGFLKKYAEVLKPGGQVIMKTDNSTLFEFSLLEFSECAWRLREVSVDFRRTEHPEDAISEYEQRFMDKGQPIYRAIWQKNG